MEHSHLREERLRLGRRFGGLSGSSDISRCVGVVTATYRAEATRERAFASIAGTAFVDTSAWFCVPVGGRQLCPAVVDGAPVWRDGTHITSDVEPKLVPLVRALAHPST
jgi:hypothetical protein